MLSGNRVHTVWNWRRFSERGCWHWWRWIWGDIDLQRGFRAGAWMWRGHIIKLIVSWQCFIVHWHWLGWRCSRFLRSKWWWRIWHWVWTWEWKGYHGWNTVWNHVMWISETWWEATCWHWGLIHVAFRRGLKWKPDIWRWKPGTGVSRLMEIRWSHQMWHFEAYIA